MRGQLMATGAAKELSADLRARQLCATDAPGLGQLMAAAYRGTIDDNGESAAWHSDDAQATLAGRYGDLIWPACFVVPSADHDGHIGVSIVVTYRGLPLLAFLLVTPHWQGRGIGTYLLARSAQALRNAGYIQWTLAVTSGNPAQRLYERSGFAVDESLRGSGASS